MLNTIAEQKRSEKELRNEYTQLQESAAKLKVHLDCSKVWIHLHVVQWHVLHPD